jgi:PIN domain nuclease of toxin-antitoxin system
MKLLLDTQIFLWYISANKQLPASYYSAIRNPANDVFLSVASLWEVTIKFHIGKLLLPQPPSTYFPRQRQLHRITNLNIDEQSVQRLDFLPNLHRDPFDRIIICQAESHELTLLTVDEAVRAYKIRMLST